MQSLKNKLGSMQQDKVRLLERYGASQQIAQSIGLIGHEVDAEDSTGATLTGTVDSVNIAAGSIVINVGSTKLSPGQIREIR